MAEYANLTVDVRDHTAIVKINRPKALNALNLDVLCNLRDAFQALSLNADVLGVMVTGEGDKAFVAGADITAMQDMSVLNAKHFAEFG